MQPRDADRSVTRPAPETDGEDLLLRLTREHRDAAGLLLALRRRTGPGAGDTAHELIADLVRHVASERSHLLPLVRRHVPDGDAVADRIAAGQQELENQLERLPDDLESLEIVDDLVTRHAEELERYVFPTLAAACPPEELVDAGRRAARTAHTGPEGAGLVDRIRALFRS